MATLNKSDQFLLTSVRYRPYTHYTLNILQMPKNNSQGKKERQEKQKKKEGMTTTKLIIYNSVHQSVSY